MDFGQVCKRFVARFVNVWTNLCLQRHLHTCRKVHICSLQVITLIQTLCSSSWMQTRLSPPSMRGRARTSTQRCTCLCDPPLNQAYPFLSGHTYLPITLPANDQHRTNSCPQNKIHHPWNLTLLCMVLLAPCLHCCHINIRRGDCITQHTQQAYSLLQSHDLGLVLLQDKSRMGSLLWAMGVHHAHPNPLDS